MEYTQQRSQLLMRLTYVSIVLFIAATLMSFTYPGTEVKSGEVQRIFYLHLGSFFGSFVVFAGAVIAGIQYLRTRDEKWDHLGVASVEVGLWLAAINIVTGAIWARPSWGTYWTWDPRLTSIAIMWLIYAAYLFLRSAIEDPEQRRRFAAVYGILAFGSVILTIVIIRIRPDVIHPVVAGPTVVQESSEGDFNLTPRIGQTVIFNIISYMIISVTLVWYRLRLQERVERARARKMELLAKL